MKNTRQFQYSMNNSIRYKTSRYEISRVNWWTAQPQVMIWAGKEWIKRNPWRSSWSKWWLTKPLNMIIWSSIMIKYHVWKLYVSLCYLPFFFFFLSCLRQGFQELSWDVKLIWKHKPILSTCLLDLGDYIGNLSGSLTLLGIATYPPHLGI